VDDEIILKMTPHTKAKHDILREYANGWVAVIGQSAGRMIYLDGFSGSDEYDDGSHGSPTIVVDCAKDHFLKERIRCETVFVFTEIHEGRFNHLKGRLEGKYGKFDEKSETFSSLPPSYKFMLRCGDFNAITDDILTGLEKEGTSLAPTLAFIDPFGYDLNLELLARILRFRRCELLITYMAGFIDRFANDAKHRDSIMRTLKVSADDLDRAASLPVDKRELVWLKYLNDTIAGETMRLTNSPTLVYPLYFRMMDKSNHTLYYLAYFTKNPKGIEVMKTAMRKVGKGFSYRFSDHDFDPRQSSIVDFLNEEPWIREEAEAVYREFAGKEVLIDKVDDWVLMDTLWLPRRASYKLLLEDGRMQIVRGGQKKGSMPPGSIVRFL
jgi:three-Cys-motif partner protein